MTAERIECPQQLLEKLRPAQEQIDRLTAEVQAALFGARLALNVPDSWRWDGAGWVERPAKSMPGEPSA